MKIGQFCYFGEVGGANKLPTNLNNWINKNTKFESKFYYSDSRIRKKNFVFLQNDALRTSISNEIYYKYCKSDIGNFSFFKAGVKFKEYLKINKLDIIHLHWVNKMLNLDDINFLSSIKPTIITLHDFHLLLGGCHFLKNCKNYLNECSNCPQIGKKISTASNQIFKNKKKIFEKNNVIFIHMNDESLRIGKELYKNNYHELIDCTVDIKKFNICKKERLLKKYNIPLNKKILVSVCAYESYTKGIWQFEKLKKELSNDYYFILIGEGFRKIRSEEGKIKNFGQIKSHTQVNELYNLSDIAFSLSLEEGVPGFACEALSCGIPFIGFKDVGNLNRMIKNNFNGYLVDPKNIKKFANTFRFNYAKKTQIRLDFIENFDKNFYKKYLLIYKNAKKIVKNTPNNSTLNLKKFIEKRRNRLDKKTKFDDFFNKLIQNRSKDKKISIRKLINFEESFEIYEKYKKNKIIDLVWSKLPDNFKDKIKTKIKKNK